MAAQLAEAEHGNAEKADDSDDSDDDSEEEDDDEMASVVRRASVARGNAAVKSATGKVTSRGGPPGDDDSDDSDDSEDNEGGPGTQLSKRKVID